MSNLGLHLAITGQIECGEVSDKIRERAALVAECLSVLPTLHCYKIYIKVVPLTLAQSTKIVVFNECIN